MRPQILSALANPIYRAVAVGNAVSMLGIWMQKVAVGWLAWDLSHSTVWLGAVAAADLLPAVFLSSFFGSLADGRNKAHLVMLAQTAAMVQSLVLATLTFTGIIEVWSLFGLTLALGVANSVDQPSRLSLLREIVEPRHLTSAITLNSISYNLARFIGPMLAGLLITRVDIGVTFLVSAATLGCFALILMRVPRPPPPSGQRPRMLAGTGDGYRYILSHPMLRRTLLVNLTFGATVGGVNQLLPALADRLFGRGVSGFVELTVSAGLGAVVAGMLLLAFPPAGRMFGRMIPCLGGAALALAALAVATDYWIGIGALFAATFTSTYAAIICQSTLIEQSRPDMLGRVMGVYSVQVRGAPSLGGFAMGMLAPFVGFPAIILACALWAAIYAILLLPGRKRN